MLLTLKIRKGNVQLFAWQLFRVRPEHSREVGGGAYDRGPFKIYWQAGGGVRRFIYDNGAWWHHTIKALCGVRCAYAARVWVFVFAMHEYIRGRAGQWLTLLSCDVLWHPLLSCLGFFQGAREQLRFTVIQVGEEKQDEWSVQQGADHTTLEDHPLDVSFFYKFVSEKILKLMNSITITDIFLSWMIRTGRQKTFVNW